MTKKDFLKIFQVIFVVMLLIFAYALYIDYNQTIKHIKYFVAGDKAVYRTFVDDYYEKIVRNVPEYKKIAKSELYKLGERIEFNQLLKTSFAEFLGEENQLLEKYKNNIYSTVCSYKQFTPQFANEVAGWWSASNDDVKKRFSEIIFSEDTINQIIQQNYGSFKTELDSLSGQFSSNLISKIKASQYKYLTETELKAITDITFQKYNLKFDSVSFKINMLPAFQIGSFIITCAVADRIITAIVSRIGAALAVRAGGAAVAAGTSWATLGISLVGGYFIDSYMQSKFAESFIPEINCEIEKVALEVSENFKTTISKQINIEICQK